MCGSWHIRCKHATLLHFAEKKFSRHHSIVGTTAMFCNSSCRAKEEGTREFSRYSRKGRNLVLHLAAASSVLLCFASFASQAQSLEGRNVTTTALFASGGFCRHILLFLTAWTEKRKEIPRFRENEREKRNVPPSPLLLRLEMSPVR